MSKATMTMSPPYALKSPSTDHLWSTVAAGPSASIRWLAEMISCYCEPKAREELEFLVNSGLSFGFFLGIFQMILWICFPNNWVLPVGGALVGYITNWVAIKLIFD
eukprot:s9073_g1.t1